MKEIGQGDKIMDIIVFAISIIFLMINLLFKRKNKLISPMIIFYAVWTFILFLSMLNLYGIYKPSDEAYFLIMLMLIFFFMGSFLTMLIKNKRIFVLRKKTEDSKVILKPRFKLFYILNILIVLFNLIDLYIIIRESMKGTPMWQIRNWSLQPYGSSNPLLDRRNFIEESIRSIILEPYSIIIPPVVAYVFFNSNDNKQRYKLLISSLAVLITSSLAGGGGRLGLIYYFGCFILAFVVLYRNKDTFKNRIKKYKRFLILLIVLAILITVIYTVIRTGKGNFVKQVYTYFALPPTLLSEWLPNIKNIEHTYGMTTFFGVHSYFFRILDTIGMDFLVPEIYKYSYTNILNAELFKDVGYGVANAFVTPIYYFIIDGGYAFVIIASFLFGYVVSNSYKKLERNINVKSFTIYALITYGMFLTFIRVQTAIPSYIISFMFVSFLLKTSIQEEYNKDYIGDKNGKK